MIRQIGWLDQKNRDFVPHAVLNKNPSYFRIKHDFHFEKGEDDLYFFEMATFILDNAIVFLLKRYLRLQDDDTTIYLPYSIKSVDHITEIVLKIVTEIGLEERDIIWQRRDSPES